MTVSPGSGGGNTVFNLLEPCRTGNNVFYATPSSFPSHWVPFPQLSGRICWFDVPLPFQLRGAGRIAFIRRANALWLSLRGPSVRRSVVRQLRKHIRDTKTDVLLLCPQNMLDLAASTELLRSTRLPAVVWFMDNYFTEGSATALVGELWREARRRFVISEAMQQYFSGSFDGDCEVLNNSVPVPAYSPPTAIPGAPLRVVYAGATHSFYLHSFMTLLNELRDLSAQVELDIYSHEGLPANFGSQVSYRLLPPVPAAELVKKLRQYDVLLLLSSFKPEHRALAETSLASKVADYLVAGRCILAFGPDYCENVRYTNRNGFGEVATSTGELRRVVEALARDPERRRELGVRAYRFGQMRHNQATNSTRLWQALIEACTMATRSN